MRKKFFLAFIVAFLLAAPWGGSLSAKVYIDITSPSFRKFPIAVAPFRVPISPSEDLKLGERATEILNNDLNICGFFALLDPITFVESSARPGPGGGNSSASGSATALSGLEAIDFRSWINIGAEALVLGEVRDRKSVV